MLKEDLEKIAAEKGMDLFGVAPVGRMRNAPGGHRPEDISPEAKSIISMAIKIPYAAVRANHLAHTRRIRELLYAYQRYGYTLLNDMLDSAAFTLCKYLEGKGFRATPIPAAAPYNAKELIGLLSNRHAAVAAGLGEFGWNGLLITPEYGPRVRVVTILSEADMEPRPLYSGPKLCDRAQCSVCIKVCPMNAIPEDKKVTVQIDGKIFEYAELKKLRCRLGVAHAPPYFQMEKVKIPEDPKPEDYLRVLELESSWLKQERAGPMCGRCLVECPVGKERVT